MRKVILYIAMSLDGYIADKNGKVDWLSGDSSAEISDAGYGDFIQKIDTVVMGWTTYHQVTTELSPDHWVYEDQHTYVITHRSISSTDAITFTAEDPCTLIRDLKSRSGSNIWICGGADIVRQLMNENLIDLYHISVIPTLLGNGVRLFPVSERELRLRLLLARYSGGITELLYEKRT